MALAAAPNNFSAQVGNGQVALSWSPSAGATGYAIERSLDGLNYTALAMTAAATYLDATVTIGQQYWYTVAATNSAGTGLATAPACAIPAPTGEMSLAQLRLMSQQRADRVNSQFVTNAEWNTFINQSMFELYDLLVTTYEDYFIAPFATFVTDGTTFQYPLPDGLLSFTNQAGQSFIAPPFYKLMGVDLGINTVTNGYVTVNKFNLIDRNRFVYPNTTSTIYGVYNLQYRLLGNKIELIPNPSSGQSVRLLYIPRLQQLLQDTDITTIGYSGWLQYVIVRAAKYALDKEESDTSSLTEEIGFLKTRIEESAMNRDVGQADTISDVRRNGWGGGSGFNGGIAGW